MGKRKSMKSKMASRKKAATLETAFSCPFCNQADSVECTFDRKLWIAKAVYRICNETYATVCHVLNEPVNVYGEWVDACERANDGVST